MREALMAAGARRFAAKGVAAVTVEELLAEVDLSRATFYGLFSSKYNLLENILQPIFEKAIESMEALAEAPPRAGLEGMLRVYLELWETHREGLLLIPAVDPPTFRHFEAQHRALNDAMSKVLMKAEQADLLRNGSAAYSLTVLARTAIPLLKVYGRHPAGHALFEDAMRALLMRES